MIMVRFVQSLWLLFVSVVVLIVPRAASAQSQTQERGFAGGLGAVTFGTVAGGDVAGRAGVNVTTHLAVFGELGRMTNALSKSDQITIDDNAAVVSAAMGETPVVSGGLPVVYGTGEVRLNADTYNRVTPYAEAGYGVAHIENKMSASIVGIGLDVSKQVLTAPLVAGLPQNDPLLSLGGGVSIAAGRRAGFDIGYRYSRIMVPNQAINTGKLYGALRVGF